MKRATLDGDNARGELRMVSCDACGHLNWGQIVDGGRDGLMQLGRGGGVHS